MSFGFSLGDFFAVGQLAWNVYKSCKGAGGAFEELSHEVIALHTALKELEDEIENPDSILNRTGAGKKAELGLLVKNCTGVLQQLNKLLTKYKSLGTTSKRTWDRLRWGAENLQDIREKLLTHTSSLTLFLTTLGTGSLGRIEKKLDQLIQDVRAGRKEETIITFTIEENNPDESGIHWDLLKGELVDDGFSKLEIEAHKHWIKAKLTELIENGGLHEQSWPEASAGYEKADGIKDYEGKSKNIVTINEKPRLSKEEIQHLLAEAEQYRKEDEAEAARIKAALQPTVEDTDEDDGKLTPSVHRKMNEARDEEKKSRTEKCTQATGNVEDDSADTYPSRREQRDPRRTEDEIRRQSEVDRAEAAPMTDFIEEAASDGSHDTFLASLSPADSVSQIGINPQPSMSRGTNDAQNESSGVAFSAAEWAKTFNPQTFQHYPSPPPREPTRYRRSVPIQPRRSPQDPNTEDDYYHDISGVTPPGARGIGAARPLTRRSGLGSRKHERRQPDISHLDLPAPPTPPKYPLHLARNPYAYNLYLAQFEAYIHSWDLFNTKKNQDDGLGIAWWKNETQLDKYTLGLEEDELVSQFWSKAREDHQRTMKDYAITKKRMDLGSEPELLPPLSSAALPSEGGGGGAFAAAGPMPRAPAVGGTRQAPNRSHSQTYYLPPPAAPEPVIREARPKLPPRESSSLASLVAEKTSDHASQSHTRLGDRRRRESPDSYDSRSPSPERRGGGDTSISALAAAGMAAWAASKKLPNPYSQPRSLRRDRRRRESPDSYDNRSPSPDRRRRSKTVTDYARKGLATLLLGEAAGAADSPDRRSSELVYAPADYRYSRRPKSREKNAGEV